jgi:hypothetical protein
MDFIKQGFSAIKDIADRVGFGDSVQGLMEKFPSLATDEIRRGIVLRKAAQFAGTTTADLMTPTDTYSNSTMDVRTDIDILIYAFLASTMGEGIAYNYAQGCSMMTDLLIRKARAADITPSSSWAFVLGNACNSKAIDETSARQKLSILSILVFAMKDPLNTIDIKKLAESASFIGQRADSAEETATDSDGKDGFYEDAGEWLAGLFNDEEKVDTDEVIQDVVVMRST